MDRRLLTLVALVMGAIIAPGALIGCAANQRQEQQPAQLSTAETGQAQPSELKVHDIRTYIFAGTQDRYLAEALKPGQENQPTAAGQPATADLLARRTASRTSAAADPAAADNATARAEYEDPNGFGIATSSTPDADARYVQNTTIVYRLWNDASAAGETGQTISQVAEMAAELEQTVRVVFSAMLELAQGLLNQMQGTISQAAEAGTADATGGAQDAEFTAKLDHLITVLDSYLDKQPEDPNAPPAEEPNAPE